MIDELARIDSPSLTKIYTLVEQILASDMQGAAGTKSARTRLRKQLSELSKLAKAARQEIPSNTTKQKPGEKNMEKYGVEQEKIEEKTAQEGVEQRCPKCNNLLEKHGDIKLCPTCGSAPFESDDTEKTG